MIDNFRQINENIQRHYVHACEAHPLFCNQLAKDKPKELSYAKLAEAAKVVRDIKAGVGICNMLDVLMAEIYEFYAACEKGDYKQAESEIFDAVAVLLRALDMIREAGKQQ